MVPAAARGTLHITTTDTTCDDAASLQPLVLSFRNALLVTQLPVALVAVSQLVYYNSDPKYPTGTKGLFDGQGSTISVSNGVVIQFQFAPISLFMLPRPNLASNLSAVEVSMSAVTVSLIL